MDMKLHRPVYRPQRTGAWWEQVGVRLRTYELQDQVPGVSKTGVSDEFSSEGYRVVTRD